ncbi:hypothetical protein MTO96_036715, partial [Rhipicephalus appendiculatus]
GTQTALKAYWAIYGWDLTVTGEREHWEGYSRTGPFGAILADDSLLTIKTPLSGKSQSGGRLLDHSAATYTAARDQDLPGGHHCQLCSIFQGHAKLILCPLMAAVTYVGNNRAFHT